VILWHRSFCVSRQRTELAFQLASCLYISLYRAGWGVLMRAICFLPASCKFWHVSRTQAPLVGDYFNYFFTQAANRVSVPAGKLPLHKQPSHLAKATQPRPSQRSPTHLCEQAEVAPRAANRGAGRDARGLRRCSWRAASSIVPVLLVPLASS
jgi:hypothetical protein